MRVKRGSVRGLFGRPAPPPVEDPIRGELFSVERLEQHAESLALAQRVAPRAGAGRRLSDRLRDNGRVLVAAYRAIAAAIREERAITPAAEWLVDNFHIAEEQIREIEDDLPSGFYRQLPKLADGALAGYPRVFGLAWAYIAHTDSLFEPQSLGRFVRAYQRVQPLTIGELWAVAITLRIVLVENLRRAADRIVRSRAARQEADVLADRLLGVGGAPEPAAVVLQRLEVLPVPDSFVVQLIQRLRDQDPAETPALRWLDDRLAAQGRTADDIVREEHQRQGAMNVTVRNVITSMRLMSAIDWAEFFESVSLVDAELRAGSACAAMDFATRDRYRHAIEALARGSGHSELEVTARALGAARAAGGEGAVAARRGDPGHYLIGNGRRAFERQLGFRPPFRDWLTRGYTAAGLFGYLAGVTLISAALVTLALLGASALGVGGALLAILGLLVLGPASDAAVALVNHHVTARFGPLALPGMELAGGVPASLRTLVAVPTLLTSRAALEEQIERLEVHHLASPDDDLHFALLTDWADAAVQLAPGDGELLAVAAQGIAELNRRHAPAAGGDRFLLLHRHRVWNAGERRWIGWERKRGKLHELNRWLRGAIDTTFVAVAGRAPIAPPDVRYVITLDADTRLPRGAARRLVGKMAHPLNRPVFDPRRGRVIDGHAVLQPRVTPTLPAAGEGSLFQRVFSGPGGMDPYAAAVSDVYQDLFGEGSYTGKGIYDVDVFEAALADRVPDSTLLSHDLLEGTFARAGLISDVEVVEEFPARYDVAAARQHRWARGDWQLLPWIFGRGRDRSGVAARRGIPLIGRWKMLDNLRRTLTAPAAFLALVLGWTLPAAPAAAWTAAVLAILALPPLLPFVAGLLPRRRGISKRSHLRAVGADLRLALSQLALLVAFLAHQTWLMADAIARTLIRMGVTRRGLLEWLTAAQATFSLPLDVGGFYRRMAGGVALAIAAALVVAGVGQGGQAIAAPFLGLWILSPVVARWASRPPPLEGANPLTDSEVRALRLVARRTWRFFETFVTAEDHMLPPDNFQEDPQPVVAHRTSPTNLGLSLLSNVAAHDFGWVGTLNTVTRLEATLATMQGLERFRGHFYNWYDTRDLRPLEPMYVSSVDSGNLAGHLLALANACRGLAVAPVIGPAWRAGIGDALELARESARALPDDRRTGTVTRGQLLEALEALGARLAMPAATPAGIAAQLPALAEQAETAADIARTLSEERGGADADAVVVWTAALLHAVRDHARDAEQLMPWAERLSEPRLAAAAAELDAALGAMPLLADLPDRCEAAMLVLRRRLPDGDAAGQLAALADALARSAGAARELERRLATLAQQARALFDAMQFGFLLDPARQLLSIGYRVAEGTLDPNCYDLLASEARLASIVAIAKGDVPPRHWMRLGRALTPVGRGLALISWSGSMFEYLMPSLVMRAPIGSLLERTSRAVVRRQIQYGAELGIPWGISESAYNVRDLALTYQYSNFGVPGLGLKRGLSEDAVVAPYATALAAMVDPAAATRNLGRLAAAGGSGPFGYYEALDYTPERLPEGASVAVVRAYMAHHQGMALVAIANAVHDGAMRARFHAEPMIQATELLLQERTPRDVAVARPRAEEVHAAANVREILPAMQRRYDTPHAAVPRTQLLSNGRYAVMVTAAGSGYSRWRDLAVTRWREDATCDAWGTYVFLRDMRSNAVWSAGHQPSGVEADSYHVEFSEGRAEITRRDGTLVTALEVAVSGEDDAEVRRVSISNLGHRARDIELTSYAEVVLAPAAADAAHPAFAKLFVHTELVADAGALLATRRRRSPGEPEVWAAHLAVVEGESLGAGEYETDRARFLGRGRDVRAPIAILDGRPLSNTVGAVLDPVFSLRRRLRVPPGATARVAFWTLVAPTREAALDLVDRHQDATSFERAVTLAWTQAQVQLHHLGIAPDEASLFQSLANHVLYSDPTLRPSPAVLALNDRGPSTLWAYGISGDLPIVLVRIDEAEDMEIVRQLLRAHEYWRLKQLAVDLVILNERSSSYTQELQGALEAQVRASQSRPTPGAEEAGGRVFVLRADLVSLEGRNLLRTAARAVLLSRRGSLSEQLKRLEELATAAVPPMVAAAPRARADVPAAPPALPPLEYFNGLGGFAADGREYLTVLGEGQCTPAPWINVIANPGFGFQVSVEGGGYTWAVNSRENQLTAWSNDPIGDRPGEAIYLRDEDSGALWGPTALPIRTAGASYTCRHGQGYSRFAHTAHGIAVELTQFVALDDPIKISRLTIRNRSGRARRLSVTAYVEWVLGTSRAVAAPYIVSEVDADTGALLARNPWSHEFAGRIAFVDLAGEQRSWTADRREFIGRNGTLEQPAGLAAGATLSDRVGAGLDPCAAMQARVDLRKDGEAEIVVFVGQAATRDEARALIRRYRAADLDGVLGVVTDHWEEVLGALQVRTPDRAMDLMLNRWLLYQTLACRVWARSGFYQASGAFGFRDQLQDVSALALARPALMREHVLRAAARQFGEGDVQHWWLPPGGQGVRTRVSDDRVWLPYAVAHYLEVSGDAAVLDEAVPFLEGPALRDGEADAFFQPLVSEEQATLFEHCARGLDRSLAVGAHGLPLIEGGDWNDGMNRVGSAGRGESVWLGWFLHATLSAFAPLAEARGEAARAAAWRQHASTVRAALEDAAWDGAWYRRGFYDDGTPFGTAADDECRIDSIAQSWAVMSAAADPARAQRAMAAVAEHLVRRDDGLVLLFTPPFDQGARDPGYIKGYPPGIRENGGQYTHAAAWAVIAAAMLGDGDRAAEWFGLLNPILHATSRAATQRYKVEPYVVCADLYSVPPHVGRGGWTWYTGSAGWLYRAGVEWLLGIRLRGAVLHLDPCIPPAWPGFEAALRHRSARYEIAVENPDGVSRGIASSELDGVRLVGDPARIPLADDGNTHRLRVRLG